jgi:CO/xanthine dehydrogenase FAD-binding subunit
MAILKAYYQPQTLNEALALLQRTEEKLAPLAGGTALIGQLEARQQRDLDGVVDLSALGLCYLHLDGDQLRIGATATLTDVIEYEHASTLADGILRRTAEAEGPLNLRNAATVGGLIASAAYDSEFYAALLALNATVTIYTAAGPTTLPLTEAPSLLVSLSPCLLITEVQIPLTALRSGHARVARTPADRPIVAAVAVIGAEGEQVAICGVAERPVLQGTPLNPPDNFKGSATYRQAMARLMVTRALAEAQR